MKILQKRLGHRDIKTTLKGFIIAIYQLNTNIID